MKMVGVNGHKQTDAGTRDRFGYLVKTTEVVIQTESSEQASKTPEPETIQYESEGKQKVNWERVLHARRIVAETGSSTKNRQSGNGSGSNLMPQGPGSARSAKTVSDTPLSLDDLTAESVRDYYDGIDESVKSLKSARALTEQVKQVNEDATLRRHEETKKTIYNMTSYWPLQMFRGFLNEPLPTLESTVNEEIEVVRLIQSRASVGLNYSHALVDNLVKYFDSLTQRFGTARERVLELEQAKEKVEGLLADRNQEQAEKSPADQDYMAVWSDAIKLWRGKLEIDSFLNADSQEILYTQVASQQALDQEYVARQVLREVQLIKATSGNFLEFVVQNRRVDEILPLLSKAAEAISGSYQVLNRIFADQTISTTQTLEEFTKASGEVDHDVMSGVANGVERQKEIMDQAMQRESFYESARKVMHSPGFYKLPTDNGKVQEASAKQPTLPEEMPPAA